MLPFQFETEEKNVNTLLAERKRLITEYSVTKQQFEVFNEIPGTNSDTWVNFIKSGVSYCEEFDLEDECPYCHRPHDEKTLEITKAYSKFIKDTTQKKLDKNTKDIQDKLLKLKNVSSVYIEDSQLSTDIEDKLKTLNEQIIKNRIYFSNKLSNRTTTAAPKIQKNLLSGLSKEIKDIETQQAELKSGWAEKEISLKKYYQQLIELEEKASLNSQFTELNDFVELKNRLFQENQTILSVNTSKLSLASKQAHTELLTDKLLETFRKKLKILGLGHLTIQLRGSNKKGVQQTELTLEGNKNIEDILSEGEQKATALALFISEISLSNNHSTIIFDDPVNSLDHRIMDKFSNLLMSLENQIVIFTHNKMFLDSFETSSQVHICKNVNGGCNKSKGKHIFLYETLSEGKDKKGIITAKQTENLKTYISDIDNLLSETPLSSDKKQLACSKLRKSVEFAIDEIILNRQVPTKYSNKNSRINWDGLKQIETNPSIIDKLRAIHGRCSGGALHNGTESEENPIDKKEIEDMLVEIKNIQSSH